MLKFVVHIILGALLLYIVVFVSMFIAAVVKYRRGTLTKADLESAAIKTKNERTARKSKRKSKKRRLSGSDDILRLAMGENVF